MKQTNLRQAIGRKLSDLKIPLTYSVDYKIREKTELGLYFQMPMPGPIFLTEFIESNNETI